MKTELKLVMIDCPYLCSDDIQARDFFGRVIYLRKTGYHSAHSENILSVDTSDFIAVHGIVCIVKDGNYEPIALFKMLPYDRTKVYNVTFPAIGLAVASKSELHLKVIEEKINICESNGRQIIYEGGMTILPNYRTDRKLVNEIKNIIQATSYYYGIENGYEVGFSLGLTRFGMDRFLTEVGYERISDKNVELPPVPTVFLDGDPALIYYRIKFSENIKKNAVEFKHYWDEKIYFGRNSVKKKAA